MKLEQLYTRKLDIRPNPAVSATDLSRTTIETEIREYVFTNEIIDHLYHILENIRKNDGSHTGIWINGYYGSGKSHFLKYVDYCLSKEYCETAFDRLIEAIREVKDPMGLQYASLGGARDLKRWFAEKAEVESIMFNLGTAFNDNTQDNRVFTSLFWNELNAKRGYNNSKLALAVHLEKYLDEQGQFGAFKERLADEGFDWNQQSVTLSVNELDYLLEIASELAPRMSIDSTRAAIMADNIDVSVNAFCKEVKEYVDKKQNKDFRLVFFVDEVSQFIGGRSQLLLQLQELVSRLPEVCGGQVWVACTAQQDLSEVIASTKVADANKEFGKILGRFEVRASLSGTKPEVITQKRILDKTPEGIAALAELYAQKKDALDTQFPLPVPYHGFNSKEEFINCYPFVPYQFQLIRRVLDAFEEKGFVDKQVHGNERSLIVLTFDIAKALKDVEMGHFVPFDRFFSTTLKNSMQHFGERAMRNARTALDSLPANIDKAFAERVMYVLFLICNMGEVDKQGFAANIENIVTLMLDTVDQNRLVLHQKVGEVIDFFTEAKVIRRDWKEDGSEYFVFLTEVESEVAKMIENQIVDQNTYAEELKKIFFKYAGNPDNKRTFGTRSFQIGVNVYGKHFLSNNPDVEVDFICQSDKRSANEYSLTHPKNKLSFFMAPLFNIDDKLKNSFAYYCKVQLYAKVTALSEEQATAKRKFAEIADEMYKRDIVPAFEKMFDACELVCAQSVLTPADMESTKGANRYKKALETLLQDVYSMASLVMAPEFPRTTADLQAKIRRAADMTLTAKQMTQAEQLVKQYLELQPHDVTVNELVNWFAKPPYGWLNVCTIYAVNELVRKGMYQYKYAGNPNINRETVAARIVTEDAKFTVEVAEAIPQSLINSFIEAWKAIFNVMNIKGSNDATELIQTCRDGENALLKEQHKNLQALADEIGAYPFKEPVIMARDQVEAWLNVRDTKEFFNAIIAAKDAGKAIFDRCKDVKGFWEDQSKSYLEIRKFVRENNDNFSFIPEEEETIKVLKKIIDDSAPYSSMAMVSYRKAYNSVKAKLEAKKKELRAAIEVACTEAFRKVSEYATQQGFPAESLPNCLTEATTRKASESLFILQGNTDFSGFETRWFDVINRYVPPMPEKPKDKGETNTPKPMKKTTHVKLSINGATLTSEKDVDAFLRGIKEQLMEHIDNNENVIPTK